MSGVQRTTDGLPLATMQSDGPKSVGILFCVECNNMLYPKEDKGLFSFFNGFWNIASFWTNSIEQYIDLKSSLIYFFYRYLLYNFDFKPNLFQQIVCLIMFVATVATQQKVSIFV